MSVFGVVLIGERKRSYPVDVVTQAFAERKERDSDIIAGKEWPERTEQFKDQIPCHGIIRRLDEIAMYAAAVDGMQSP